jgi:glycine C-acetyltransferase
MTYRRQLRAELTEIEADGLLKREHPIVGPQGSTIGLEDGRRVINFCANNYLGLASHPDVVRAAHDGLDRWGYGLASVRFICGTQTVHKELERAISRFLGTEDTILYSSCFDANTGLFETILDERDAIVSDALNHASIIDGIRLCKAQRLRYANRNMTELRSALESARAGDARRILIATDGVFSMDGHMAPLDDICELADEFDALVMVDDSHAVGVVGPTGRGTPERFGVADRVDIVTGTLGKALGGASGGYTSGRSEIIEMLRQRSRPYLFSNSLAPPIAAASIAALAVIWDDGDLRQRLTANAASFRTRMTEAGFDVLTGEHPIVPVMFGDAHVANAIADALLEAGVYAVAFSYPVVPRGMARIRIQLSALHSTDEVDVAVRAFIAARDRLKSDD